MDERTTSKKTSNPESLAPAWTGKMLDKFNLFPHLPTFFYPLFSDRKGFAHSQRILGLGTRLKNDWKNSLLSKIEHFTSSHITISRIFC